MVNLDIGPQHSSNYRAPEFPVDESKMPVVEIETCCDQAKRIFRDQIQPFYNFLVVLLMIFTFINNNWLTVEYHDSKVSCGLFFCCINLPTSDGSLCAYDIIYIRNGTFKHLAFKTESIIPNMEALYANAQNLIAGLETTINLKKPVIDAPGFSVGNFLSYISISGNSSYLAVLSIFIISICLLTLQFPIRLIVKFDIPQHADIVVQAAVSMAWIAATATATVYLAIDTGSYGDLIKVKPGLAVVLMFLVTWILSIEQLCSLDKKKWLQQVWELKDYV